MRAGVYARISKDSEGTELGVIRQQDDCRREAERRGWDVVATYVDNDVSATRAKVRPEYERMLRDISSGRVNALVVWDIDRLTRTPRELEDIIDLADKHGLALANVGGEIDLSTSDGRMMARIKGTLARREVEQMSKRLKRKFLEKAEKGEPHGYAPYGFERVDGRNVVVPSEAAVIRECADRVLRGGSLRSIATDLNERGVHGPKSPKWNSTILRQILLRPTNAGLRQYQGKIIGRANNDGVIFDEDMLNRLTSVLRDPSRKSNLSGPDFKYLLGGIALCGVCGGRMRRQMGRTVKNARTGGSKRQPPSYQCSECFRVRRNQEKVDEVVVSAVVARLSMPDAVDLFSTGDSDAARDAEQAIAAIDAKLDKAADQFTDDEITAAQLKRITAKLRANRDQEQRRLQDARPSTALTEMTKGDVHANWETLPLGAQREVIETLMAVTILPSGSGRRFDPEDVSIAWRT